MKLLRKVLVYSWIAMIALHSASQMHILCEEFSAVASLQGSAFKPTKSLYASSDNLPALQTKPSQWSIHLLFKRILRLSEVFQLHSLAHNVATLLLAVFLHFTASSKGLDVSTIHFSISFFLVISSFH